MGKICCVSFSYLTLALKFPRILGVLLAFNQGSALADVLEVV
ncbi:hypothetical protein COO91_01069 [Nostoc flagelliforme CCNUN1]|uniref:Uncharacterized protein n=1 Tax=Nostoc flagelliforme CCNUN1 TaxID=2038116 RepID=A0A2K8SIC7_9NOSO|nr:hypothetical protein COO91_01069 [Nostoc flagelliforme CCNUN1]